MDKKWLSYWKKSLSDSLKADINLDKSEYFEIEGLNVFDSFLTASKNVNKLIDFEENRINKKKGITGKNGKIDPLKTEEKAPQMLSVSIRCLQEWRDKRRRVISLYMLNI